MRSVPSVSWLFLPSTVLLLPPCLRYRWFMNTEASALISGVAKFFACDRLGPASAASAAALQKVNCVNTGVQGSPAEESPTSHNSKPLEHRQGSPSPEVEGDEWWEEHWERRPLSYLLSCLLADQKVLEPHIFSTIAEMETPYLSSSTGTSSSTEL
uniref:Putative transposase n=1 Tax=Ixodes ricinus TaxID=34613 RepID=A0A6B0UWU1_IXORI